MKAILDFIVNSFRKIRNSGASTMECPKCGAQLEETGNWPRVMQNTIFMIVLLIGYQITLTFFVSRYDADEIRNIFLLVMNIGVAIVSAYLGKKGLEKFAVPIESARERRSED